MGVLSESWCFCKGVGKTERMKPPFSPIKVPPWPQSPAPAMELLVPDSLSTRISSWLLMLIFPPLLLLRVQRSASKMAWLLTSSLTGFFIYNSYIIVVVDVDICIPFYLLGLSLFDEKKVGYLVEVKCLIEIDSK